MISESLKDQSHIDKVNSIIRGAESCRFNANRILWEIVSILVHRYEEENVAIRIQNYDDKQVIFQVGGAYIIWSIEKGFEA